MLLLKLRPIESTKVKNLAVAAEKSPLQSFCRRLWHPYVDDRLTASRLLGCVVRIP